jgi:hypothetical protein
MKREYKEAAMLAVTTGRLWQAADYYKRVTSGRSVKLASALIVGIDVSDGVKSRQLGVDGPKRRALDSVVDSVIISAALTSIYKKHPEARPYVGMLALREAFVGSGWALDLQKSRQVKKGDKFHKLPSLSLAAFGLAAHHGSEKAMRVTGAAALGINAALAYDYFKGWTQPDRNVMLDTGVAEVPGFYNARMAVSKLGAGLLQLGAASEAPLQLEAQKESFVDGTCIELPDTAA